MEASRQEQHTTVLGVAGISYWFGGERAAQPELAKRIDEHQRAPDAPNRAALDRRVSRLESELAAQRGISDRTTDSNQERARQSETSGSNEEATVVIDGEVLQAVMTSEGTDSSWSRGRETQIASSLQQSSFDIQVRAVRCARSMCQIRFAPNQGFAASQMQDVLMQIQPEGSFLSEFDSAGREYVVYVAREGDLRIPETLSPE